MTTASVVIDNYNYGRFLRRAIDSVLSQTKAPIDIIVVDDGSTDGSQDIIRSYGDRIKPVLKSNGGQGSAFNAGFELARGDVVLFLDSDDMMYPDTVETVLDSWGDGVVLVQYYMDVVDLEGRVLGVHPPMPIRLAEGDVRGELLERGRFSNTLTSGLAFSRAALGRIMPMDAARFTQAADGYLVRGVALQGPVQVIDRRLSQQCRHQANDSEFVSDREGLVKSIRKQMRYMGNEFFAVKELATAFGQSAQQDMDERDAPYLGYRLLSLALDPQGHPVAGDTLGRLWRKYSESRLNSSDTWSSRLLDLGLATASLTLPSSAVFPLVSWRYNADSRPAWMKQLSQLLRR